MNYSSKYSVNMPKRFSKLSKIIPCYNNTFVFLAANYPFGSTIVHLSKQGKVLKEKQISEYEFELISDRQVVYLQPKENRISKWNLESNQISTTMFYFTTEDNTHEKALHYFSQTRSICIVETDRINSFIKFSYFSNELAPSSQPYYTFESESLWNGDYEMKKVNNKSTIALIKYSSAFGSYKLYIKTFSLQKGKQQIREFSIVADSFLKKKNEEFWEVYFVLELWELTKEIYFIKFINSFSSEAPPFYCLLDKKKKQLCEVEEYHEKLPQLSIESIYLGEKITIDQLNKECSKKENVVYYVSKAKEKQVKNLWKLKYSQEERIFPGCEGNLVIQLNFFKEKQEVKSFIIEENKNFDPREITVLFLKETIHRVDEDILYDVTRLIDYS